MSSIWTQKDPDKKFTETKEPLANTDPIEGSPFPYEDTFSKQPWGEYGFIYDSPFTSARFGTLADYDTGEGVMPGPQNVPSGDIAPAGGGPAPAAADPTDCADFTEKAFCNSDNPNDAQVLFCHGILDGCEFLRYLKATWEHWRLEYIAATDGNEFTFKLVWAANINSRSQILIDDLGSCAEYDIFIHYFDSQDGPDEVTGVIQLWDLDTQTLLVDETNTKASTTFLGAEILTHMNDFWAAVQVEFNSNCTVCDTTILWVPNN